MAHKNSCRRAGTWITDASQDYWYQSFAVRICPRHPEQRVHTFRPCIRSHRSFTSPWISPGRPFRDVSIIVFSACHRHRCGCAAVSESSSRSLLVSQQQRERKRYAELFSFQGARVEQLSNRDFGNALLTW